MARNGIGNGSGGLNRSWEWLKNNLNFFRLHLLIFILTPLIFSGIFYAANSVEIAYIDCLFLCVSAMTVTGLSTINMSTSTDFQQAILFFLMSIGSLVVVSISMVLTRRSYFQKRFKNLVKYSPEARRRLEDLKRLEDARESSEEKSSQPSENAHQNADYEGDKSFANSDRVVRTDMIRRTEQPPTLINKRIIEEENYNEPQTSSGVLNLKETNASPIQETFSIPAVTPTMSNFPRTQTIGFANPSEVRGRASRVGTGIGMERSATMMSSASSSRRVNRTGVPLSRTQTSAKERGLGGFPGPVDVTRSIIKKAFPQTVSSMTTMTRTSTIASTRSGNNQAESAEQSAPYFSFDVTVSKNSKFHDLTEAQREELGGVEYRALNVLAILLPAYWIMIILVTVLCAAPWLASNNSDAVEAREVFTAQGITAPNTTWYTFFQMTSAFTNCGLSLIDTSMISLANKYALLIPMGFLILVGNTAFPVMLRFVIWSTSKVIPKESKLFETLRFLLDHPRRCFVYLFPAGQTRLLMIVLILFNSIDWILFEILDLSNETITSLPVGQRIFDGLFQSIAVRTAGFQVVGFLGIAPSVQLAYVVMMYLSAFPISLSVRSTNVYEEKALGVYTEDDQSEEFNDEKVNKENTPIMWGSYLAAHARHQMSYDFWWLALAIWVICIIERENIEDPNTDTFFTVFSVLFEVVSAYGTVGLSLGTPTDNFSLSGRFKTLSKLVLMAVMLRGRHRGLPNAIDRAILLPNDLDVEDAQEWSLMDPQGDEEDRRQSFPLTQTLEREPQFQNQAQAEKSKSLKGE